MKRNNTHRTIYKSKVIVLALVFVCALCPLSFAANLALDSQGYLFLHPFFKARAWRASLDRLDLIMPDSLAKYRPQGFDVSQGRDSAVAVFSANNASLFCMPVRYESLIAPCLDNALTFDPPSGVALGNLALGDPRAFHVVKDSLYSFDSLRVVLPSAVAASLKVYIAGIRLSSSSVTRLDSVTLTPSRTGQRILGVFGDPDTLTLQDRGIWVTGSQGLLRYIPYTNRAWGAVVQRDLADTSTVLHTNGVYAGTKEGRLYKKNVAGTAFVQEGSSSSKPVWRVYQQGAIGNGGLFKENTNGVWKRDTAFGSFAWRYANYIRRPGGFGVELLDTNWAYKAYTFRDTSTIIQSTVPATLMTSINATSYQYPRTGTVNITVNLNDPDSNYSDYRLILDGTTNLKNDGTYLIDQSSIADTETCHIGALKMTTGSLRLTLTVDTLKIANDCVIGALNPTCKSCYWKKYTFARSVKWVPYSVVVVSTATQTLSIVNGISTVTSSRAEKMAAGAVFCAGFADNTVVVEFPLKNGARAMGIIIHDLRGRLLASIPVQNTRMLTLPKLYKNPGVVIISCRLSDGSVVSRKLPIVR